MTTLWLAAAYHLPATYSCRIPMSSMSSAPVLPAPGPATVRQALIGSGIEYVGEGIMREEIFPSLRAIPIKIQPPERVGISRQRLRAAKWEKRQGGKAGMHESVVVREMAQTNGTMTVYLQIPEELEHQYRTLLGAVGYWGQTDSLACCVGLCEQEPREGDYALPLFSLGVKRPLQRFVSSLVTEFRDPQVSWEEITAPFPLGRGPSPLRLEVYVWPLVITSQKGAGTLLERRCLLPGDPQ
jgi:hypothetical protein